MEENDLKILSERWHAEFGKRLEIDAYWREFCTDARTDRAIVSEVIDQLAAAYIDKKQMRQVTWQDIPTLSEVKRLYFSRKSRKNDAEIAAFAGNGTTCYCCNFGWLWIATDINANVIDVCGGAKIREMPYLIMGPCSCAAGRHWAGDRYQDASTEWLRNVTKFGVSPFLQPHWPKYPQKLKDEIKSMGQAPCDFGGDKILRWYIAEAFSQSKKAS